MDQARKEKFAAKLKALLMDLEGEAAQTVDGMRGETGMFPDPTDRATLETDRNLTLRIRDRERKLRDKINESLARVEDGTFGICEVCGDEIGETRLEARPMTTLCIKCKEVQEKDEIKEKRG
ncbi:MAG: RNA polymerase-binding protein DksA [Deltaproteobacteria bacterium]|nr:RNA polymerase-binding protein DksA [Deltaproteobacteria bacterium]